MEMVRKRLLLLAPALLVLSIFACAPKDPIRGALDGVVRAAESRDAAGVGGFLAADFHDVNGDDRAEAIDLVRRSLAGYEKVSLRLSDVTIQKGVETAGATFRLEMSGKPRAVAGLEGLLPRESNWRFELHFVLEKGAWKINAASWSRLGEGG